MEYEEFMRELEEDTELRGTVNLYKDDTAGQGKITPTPDARRVPQISDEEDDESDASDIEVKLEELLDELTINEDEEDNGSAYGSADKNVFAALEDEEDN